MGKFILLVFVALFTARAAEASGLYLSMGYARPNASFSSRQLVASSDRTLMPDPNGLNCGFPDSFGFTMCAWPGYDEEDSGNFVPGWPGTEGMLGITAEAEEWGDNTPANVKFTPRNTTQYIYAVGWDFARTPFRVELEQARTKFTSDGFTMSIAQSCSAGNTDCDEFYTGPDYWTFDLTGGKWPNLSATATTLMLNTYFVFPYFGNFDPYVGVGIGRMKIDTSFAGQKGGTSNENAVQFMLGVEYWVPDTGWVVGLEFRQSRISGAQEIDDPNNYLDFSQRAIVFKVRYDFISDEF